jgi:hypothetical protein
MIFWILFFFIIGSDCQWVPSGTIPDLVIALSPDGSTAIANTGIYIQTGSSTWTLTHPFTFTNMKGLFLSRDGTVFAISNSTSFGYNIDMFSKINGIWTVSSIIYGSSLGVDSDAFLYPAAVKSDGKTMVVVSIGQKSFGTDIFILVGNGLNFNFQQQLLDLPYLVFHELSYSLDGSTLAILWRFPSNSELGSPVYIYSRGNDGVYKIVEEHSSFSSWYRFAISSDSQFLIGSTNSPDTDIHLFFFSRINNRYQQVQDIYNSECYAVEDLSVSSHASFVFLSCMMPTGLYSVFILQQSNQTSWSVVQTLADSKPGDSDFGESLQNSFDGSILLSSAYNPHTGGQDVTNSYTNSAFPSPPPPQATAKTTASATSSASSTFSSAASASATSSTSATSTSSSSATHSASISSTGSSSSTQTPSWSASPTNNADNASSLSPFSSPSVTITISVLSTAIILFSIAVFVNWFRKYYIQNSSVRLYAGGSRSMSNNQDDDDDDENRGVAPGDPLLYRIN